MRAAGREGPYSRDHRLLSFLHLRRERAAPVPALSAASYADPSTAPSPLAPLPPVSVRSGTSSAVGTVSSAVSTSSRRSPVSGSPVVGPECPTCRLPTLATETPGRFGCPLCGHHLGAPQAAASAPASPAPAPGSRRSEELLAAWLSGSAIPCPKCRTPLGHAGPGEFVCRKCGERRSVGALGVAPPRGLGAAAP
ncbi:MAG: hypothetical protein L3K04_00495 [Thermoplasmata archaeon]|nr:hypothetical protein [Thermoplasmata archaeon]